MLETSPHNSIELENSIKGTTYSLVAKWKKSWDLSQALAPKMEDKERKKMKFFSNPLESLQRSHLKKKNGREKKKMSLGFALKWKWVNELNEFISSPYKLLFAQNPPFILLFTIEVKCRLIWSISSKMDSSQLWKLTYSSRYTRWYQEFPYLTKYVKTRIYEKVLSSPCLSLNSI